ncbi:MAG: type III pantothenate kinase [Planctomycetota bacterium]
MPELNLLAVSVGNTRTRIGGFVEGKLAETATFVNDKNAKLTDAIDRAYTPLRERENTVVLLSSVNPTIAEPIQQTLAAHLGHEVCLVERDYPIPVGRQLDPEAMTGEDRLLNAAAAYDVLKQACVVVDAGTAITIDFIDGGGTFHGGAIAPGAQLMMDSLNQRTAQLPEVEFARPHEVIGHNTLEAMKSGVFHGLRGMVRELVEQFAEAAGQFPLVVATGGDAPTLFQDFELIDRIVPDLTLMGLAATLRIAAERAEADGDD